MRVFRFTTVFAFGALGALLNACMLNPAVFGTYGADRLGENRFVVRIDGDRLNELGGPGSPGLKAHVAQELARKNLCTRGHTILNEGTGRGYYSVRGRCDG